MLCNIGRFTGASSWILRIDTLQPYSLYFTARMLLGWLFTARLDKGFYPQLWWCSQILGSPEIIPNLWKFQCLSSTPKNQKMSPEGHQQVSKWHQKPPLRHQIAVSLTKVKSFKNHCIYYGLSTSSLWILASFPTLDHQTDGPGNCLPLWHPKSQKITQLYPKWVPRGSQNGP